MALSGLCLVHCIAGLLFLSVLAIAGDALANPLFHELGLAIALPLAAFALGVGYRRHRRLLPFLTGLPGLMLMAAALSIPHGDRREVAMTMTGVLLVAIGHYLNRRVTTTHHRPAA